MKKTVFALFAVLLVLMMAACDLFDQPLDTESVQFMDDGRPAANLTIRFESTSRALVAADAPGNADFYEVVFKDPDTASNPDKYYVKSFSTADSQANRTITIPAGDYTSDAKAVIFAGKDGADKILLGIGDITSVDGNAINAGPATIGTGKHTVTFKITALTAGVTTPQSTSTFRILGPDPTTGTSYATGTTHDNPTITITSGGAVIPIFPIPPKGTANGDTSFTNTAANIIGEYTVNLTSHSAAVKLSGTWNVTPTSFTGGAATYTGTSTSKSGFTGTGSVICTAEGSPAGSQLNVSSNILSLKFIVDVTDTNITGNGLCQVLIDVPVKALAPATPTPTYVGTETTWHIRPGINAAGYDGSSATPNTGALIILDIGGDLIANVETTQPGTTTW